LIRQYNFYNVTPECNSISFRVTGMRIPDCNDWKKLIRTAFGDSTTMGVLMQLGFRNLGYFLVVEGDGCFQPDLKVSCWWNKESMKDYS